MRTSGALSARFRQKLDLVKRSALAGRAGFARISRGVEEAAAAEDRRRAAGGQQEEVVV
jgi:hypothetical protein